MFSFPKQFLDSVIDVHRQSQWTIEVSNDSESYIANRSFDTCEDFSLSAYTDSTDYIYVNFYDLPLASGTS